METYTRSVTARATPSHLQQNTASCTQYGISATGLAEMEVKAVILLCPMSPVSGIHMQQQHIKAHICLAPTCSCIKCPEESKANAFVD